MSGLSLGSRSNKALLLDGGFVVMGRAWPAGNEHGRYTPPSKPEPIEGSAGWGQAQGAGGQQRVCPQWQLPITHASQSPLNRCRGPPYKVAKGSADGLSSWSLLLAEHNASKKRLLTYPSSSLQRFLNLWVVSDYAKWLLPISFCLTFVSCKRL